MLLLLVIRGNILYQSVEVQPREILGSARSRDVRAISVAFDDNLSVLTTSRWSDGWSGGRDGNER